MRNPSHSDIAFELQVSLPAGGGLAGAGGQGPQLRAGGQWPTEGSGRVFRSSELASGGKGGLGAIGISKSALQEGAKELPGAL